MKKVITILLCLISTYVFADVHSFEYEGEWIQSHQRNGYNKIFEGKFYSQCYSDIDIYQIDENNDLIYESKLETLHQVVDFAIVDGKMFLLLSVFDFDNDIFQILDLNTNELLFEENIDELWNANFIYSEDKLLINYANQPSVFVDTENNCLVQPNTNIVYPKLIHNNKLYAFSPNLNIYNIDDIQNPILINESDYTLSQTGYSFKKSTLAHYNENTFLLHLEQQLPPYSSVIRLIEFADGNFVTLGSVSLEIGMSIQSNKPVFIDDKIIVPFEYSDETNQEIAKIYQINENDFEFISSINFQDTQNNDIDLDNGNAVIYNEFCYFGFRNEKIYRYNIYSDDVSSTQEALGEFSDNLYRPILQPNFVLFFRGNQIIKKIAPDAEEIVLYENNLDYDISERFVYDDGKLYLPFINAMNPNEVLFLQVISVEDGSIIQQIDDWHYQSFTVINGVIYACNGDDDSITIGTINENGFTINDIITTKNFGEVQIIYSDGTYTYFYGSLIDDSGFHFHFGIIDPETNQIVGTYSGIDFGVSDQYYPTIRYIDSDKIIIYLYPFAVDGLYYLKIFSHEDFTNLVEIDSIQNDFPIVVLCTEDIIMTNLDKKIEVRENSGLNFNNPYYQYFFNGEVFSFELHEDRIFVNTRSTIRSFTYSTFTNTDEVAISDHNLSNHPNPFSLSNSRSNITNINFNLKENGKVQLDVYNIKGQKIKNLCNSDLTKGNINFTWDGSNKNGEKVSSGVYFYQLRIDGETINTKKCLLMK